MPRARAPANHHARHSDRFSAVAESQHRIVIVGGGIAGLAAAQRALALSDPSGIIVVEQADRLGGKIATEMVDGFVIEGGPDCFLAAKPAGVTLCADLGIEHRLQATDQRFRRSYVKRRGRLHLLPEGISGLVPSRVWPLLTTRILSLRGRLRAGLEIVVPPRRDGRDESIAAFVSRRFGVEAYDWLVEPLLSGIYAGDGTRLSLEATFPQLREMERAHGSVLRALLWSARQSAGLVTLAGGLRELVQALERRLAGVTLLRGIAARSVTRTTDGYVVTLADGRTVAARTVVLATPAFVTAELVRTLDPVLAATLQEIPFVSTATVSVAFPRSSVPRGFGGSGYVSPRAEGGSVVACTWTSNKFPMRAPEDHVLLRFFVGRAGREEVALAGDDAIKAVVRRELHDVLRIVEEPRFWKIFRWPQALPQYVLGHRERLERIERRLASHPGLALAGCSYRGVGIPDCIASGWAAADAALASAS